LADALDVGIEDVKGICERERPDLLVGILFLLVVICGSAGCGRVLLLKSILVKAWTLMKSI
jgi:hypothetical protein